MKIVALTGAGISAESGVKTFRGSDGLWEGHAIEDVATPEAFARNPTLVYEFYNQRRAQLLQPELEPNQGHLALARLEEALGNHFWLITQNVDNLHERAGNKNIYHMHGELQKVRCLKTEKSYDWTGPLDETSEHPEGLNTQLRPDIVWFGEIPKYMEEIERLLFDCDIFLCIGTSGLVYPAAGFVRLTPHGCQKIEFNVESTQISENFDQTIHGPAGETLKNWVDQFLEN
ncbi:MAG: NAD-dependent deacylase [Pseudomonadota bacterium]